MEKYLEEYIPSLSFDSRPQACFSGNCSEQLTAQHQRAQQLQAAQHKSVHNQMKQSTAQNKVRRTLGKKCDRGKHSLRNIFQELIEISYQMMQTNFCYTCTKYSRTFQCKGRFVKNAKSKGVIKIYPDSSVTSP